LTCAGSAVAEQASYTFSSRMFAGIHPSTGPGRCTWYAYSRRTGVASPTTPTTITHTQAIENGHAPLARTFTTGHNCLERRWKQRWTSNTRLVIFIKTVRTSSRPARRCENLICRALHIMTESPAVGAQCHTGSFQAG